MVLEKSVSRSLFLMSLLVLNTTQAKADEPEVIEPVEDVEQVQVVKVNEAKKPTLFAPYGFLKFNSVSGSRAVMSGGNKNLTNPTMVRPNIDPTDGYSRNTFQAAQTRIGTWIHSPWKSLRGQIEFDFLDLRKSSPTLASFPRVRIAKIVYAPRDGQELALGQDWEPFSPFRPFSNGLIGVMFQTGNIGFMRQQAKWTMSFGNYTGAFAAILPGRNDDPTDTQLELGFSPGLNHQSTLSLSKSTKIGFSVMGSIPKMNQIPGDFFGVNLFWNWKWAGVVEMRAYTYYGKDLQTIGALGLSSNNNHEAGGYFSFSGDITPSWIYSGGYGIAHIMEAGGSPAVGLKNCFVTDNMKLDLSVAYRVNPEFKIFAEYVYMLSKFSPGSAGGEVPEGAHVTELGGRYDF